MSGAPFSPQGDDDGLDDADDRGDEERAQDAEEFSAGDQGGDGNDGMQPDSMAHDARADEVALEGMDTDEIDQDDDGEQPGLVCQVYKPAISSGE